MSVLFFVAEVSGPDPAYRAAFPDLPGCLVEAGDLPLLLARARAQARRYLQALSDKGDWPSPTPIREVVVAAGSVLVLLDVAVEDQPVRVNISIGERLLERIDAEATRRSMTRSGFMAHAARVSLGEGAGVHDEFRDMGRKFQEELAALSQKINDSVGPESAFSRRMNALDGLLYDRVKKAADGVSAAMARRRQALQPSQADVASAQPPGNGTME